MRIKNDNITSTTLVVLSRLLFARIVGNPCFGGVRVRFFSNVAIFTRFCDFAQVVYFSEVNESKFWTFLSPSVFFFAVFTLSTDMSLSLRPKTSA